MAAPACPPPRDPDAPPPPPAPVPPGPAADWNGVSIARSTGHWWRCGDAFSVRAAARVGAADGYGTWTDAVAAAAAMSAGAAAAIAICDDRGRLYLHRLERRTMLGGYAPLRLGERWETGYRFSTSDVRGLVDGDLLLSRGDCLVPWVAMPGASRR